MSEALWNLQLDIMWFVQLALLGVKVFAFVNSLLWSPQHYTAAGKLTKPAWNIILGVGMLLQLYPVVPIPMLGLAFTVAALVYLVDVRPAMAGLSRRR